MQQRISITLESNEFAGLIADAQANLRNPREHLRYILRRYLEQRELLPPAGHAEGPISTSKVDHEQ